MLRSLESTTYGTLRFLEAIDGKLYVQVIEEGISNTMLNGVNLFTIDFIDDGEVIDVMLDIFGNPHTIKELTLPNSFIDQFGNDYLDKVLSYDNNFATPINNESIITYYETVFTRVNNNRYAKFIVSFIEPHHVGNSWYEMVVSMNGAQNLWWFDQMIYNNQTNVSLVENIVKALELKVQVWNGYEWITQGTIQPGARLNGKFLVELDLEGINFNEVRVRLVTPTDGAYLIDSVGIDFSENLRMIVNKLQLDSAILNGTENVFDIVNNLYNEKYVQLKDQEKVILGFNSIPLLEGYTRSYGAGVKGYIYTHPKAITRDPLTDLMQGKTQEEIIQIILDSGRVELIEDIDLVIDFLDMILYLGSLNEEEILRNFLE